MASFLLQEDGSSHYLLEDGASTLLLEDSAEVTPPEEALTAGAVAVVKNVPRRPAADDEDEAVALTVALAVRRLLHG